MGRIQGLAESGVLDTNTLLKTGEGYVFSITIAFAGVTAGQKCFLRDGLNAAAPVEVAFVFGAANGTITKEWPQGKKFDTGIFWDAGAGDAGDAVIAECTFK